MNHKTRCKIVKKDSLQVKNFELIKKKMKNKLLKINKIIKKIENKLLKINKKIKKKLKINYCL